MKIIFLLILASYEPLHAAKILIISSDIGTSHMLSMIAYAHSLAESGDKVVIKMALWEPKSLSSTVEERMTIVNNPALEQSQKDGEKGFAQFIWSTDSTSYTMYPPWQSGLVIFNHILANQSIDFWRTANDTFDLVVVDSEFSVEGAAQALFHKRQHSTPYILFHTTYLESPLAKYRKLFWSDVAAPPYFLEHKTGDWSENRFFDRIHAFYDNFLFRFVYLWRLEYELNSAISPYVGQFTFRDYVEGSSISLVDYFDRIGWAQPVSRQLIHGGAYCDAPKPLPDDLEAFVNDTDSMGTIYMAFGTAVKWENAPGGKLDKYVEILSELKEFRILWSYKGPPLNLPKHIRTAKWLPQRDLLFHRRTKLFFSHGGLKSVKEAICASVPVIYMPLFAEQIRNSFLCRKYGFGEYVNKKELTVDSVASKIRRITSNRRAYANVQRTKSLYMDRIIDSLSEVVFWTHKLIKNPSNLSKFYSPKPKDDNYGKLCLFFAFLNSETMLHLNIGGRTYRIRHQTLKTRGENSYLSRFASLSHEDRMLKADDFTDPEYYFERSPKYFDPIFDYHVTGNLHIPTDMCKERLLTEIEFWEIPRRALIDCCSRDFARFLKSQHQVTLVESPTVTEIPNLNGGILNDEFQGRVLRDYRRKLSRSFDDPNSSHLAKCFSLLTITFVLLSVAGLVAGSVPKLQVDGEPHPYFEYLETVCIAWFTLEYSTRLLVSAHKCRFIRVPLNVIDLLTILPFYAELGLKLFGFNAKDLGSITGLMLVMRILRVLRVARVLKLARYSSNLQLFGKTMKSSAREFSLLVMFLVVCMVFFSTLIYFAEKDDNDDFESIPAAAWWCIVTMTTIGYGDVVPITIAGKLIASAASICGIMVLAFPISMIVENFSRVQQTEEQEQINTTMGHQPLETTEF